MFKKLRSIIYSTPDLVAAKQWYIKATGIEPYYDQPYYVGFDINGYELGLDPNATGGPGNQTIAYWAVDDAEKAANKLIELGGTPVQARTHTGDGIYVAIVSDPFGNHLGLIEGA